MNKKNQIKFYALVTIATLLIITVGIGFAYFMAEVAENPLTDLTVEVSENARLEFSNDDSYIEIEATLDNFGSTNGDLSDTATSTVTLYANEAYTTTYYAYFIISENEFIYTVDSDTPELLLKIFDPEDNEITSIEGLTYDYDLGGFDVTEASGVFEIASLYEISTTEDKNEVSQEWEFELTFVNLDTLQNDNAGKSFDSYVLMQQDEITLLSEQILMDENNYSSVEEAISAITNKEEPDFSKTETTDAGIYKTVDNYGNSYYFRGATEDNYVEFAGMLWRIIRIDGEGNIKLMLYNEDAANATTYIAIEDGIEFKWDYRFTIKYYETALGDGIDSWYTEKLQTDYEVYLTKSSYCIENTALDEIGDKDLFGAYYRLINSEPSYLCETTLEDTFEYFTYAALISTDEVSFAGGTITDTNTDYYLYSSTGDYWTLSSAGFNISGGDSYMWWMYLVNENGLIKAIETETVYAESLIYPTISLDDTSIYLEGNGTFENPYKIITS